MERKITVGYWYIVGGPAGATVTVKGEVNPCCTVPEGGQGSFYAQAPVVVVSDEAITLSQVVNFKCAPVKRWLLGLGRGVQTLPAGYLAAEFLEASAAYVQVPFSFDLSKDEVRIEMATSISSATGAQNEGYADGTSNNFAIGQRYSKISVTLGTGLGRESDDLIDGAFYEFWCLFNGSGYSFGENETVWNSLSGNYKNIVSHYNLFSRTTSTAMLWKTKRKWWKAFKNGKLLFDLIPALDLQGQPVFYNKVDRSKYGNSGKLIVGFTLDQASNLRKLPATGGNLTVSLPWEAQFEDTGVPTALQTAADKGWTITVQYREDDSERISRYAACQTVAAMKAVNEDFINDLTAAGEWVYPLPNVKSFYNGNYNSYWIGSLIKKWSVPLPSATDLRSFFGTWKKNVPIEVIELEAPEATDLDSLALCCENLKRVKLNIPKAITVSWAFGYCYAVEEIEIIGDNITKLSQLVERCPSLKKLTVNTAKVTTAHAMFATDVNKTYTDADIPLEYPSLSVGSRMFEHQELKDWQVETILNSLPTWDDGEAHTLTLGIHVDYKTDDEVLSAIANAEAKGWTITAQWMGTATAQKASTFGLRSPAIYAKVGSMMLPDGTTEQYLDWGHYVTNAEENGYREFGSVEEAKEYFNIIDEA